MNMNKIGRIVGLKIGMAIFCATALAATAFAEEPKPATGLNPDDVKKALGISFYLQGGYTYNTGNPASQENDLRVFDHKADSFGLDLAQIVITKDVTTPDSSGFKIKLSSGETAKWIHARGLSGAALTSSQAGEGTDAFDVTEAYVSYLAPLGKGLRFDLGKMATYFGAEVIEAKDNANYSRSLLFNYAIPFTHTGLKMGYGFTDALSVSAHVCNGWDNATDNNKGKSLGLSIGITPAESFAAVLNYMAGPEQDNMTRNPRKLADAVVTIKPTKKLALILNYDSATEKMGVVSTGEDAKWSGAAGIIKYDLTDKYSLSVRAESFDDKNGVRTGTAQKLTEYTVTPEIRLNGGLILRPEYRHDASNVYSFKAGEKKSQDTIALGVMYSW